MIIIIRFNPQKRKKKKKTQIDKKLKRVKFNMVDIATKMIMGVILFLIMKMQNNSSFLQIKLIINKIT